MKRISLFALIAFALALAFGLGGQKHAAELLDRLAGARAQAKTPPEPPRPVI